MDFRFLLGMLDTDWFLDLDGLGFLRKMDRYGLVFLDLDFGFQRIFVFVNLLSFD